MWPCPRLTGVTTTTKKSPIVSRILGDVYSVPESESGDKEFLYTPDLIVVMTKSFLELEVGYIYLPALHTDNRREQNNRI